MIRRGISLVLFIFACCCSAYAASLDDYYKRIEDARFSVDEFLDTWPPNKGRSGADLTRVTGHLRELLPVTERVEWRGGSVEADNSWLSEMLEELSHDAATPEGRTTLKRISERLQGISNAVNDLRKAAEGDRTKDEDKQKLADILSRIDFRKAEEPKESLFDKIIRKIVEWLRDVVPQPSVAPELSDTDSMRGVVQVLVYGGIVLLIAFGVYKLAPFIGLTGSKNKKEKKKARVILGEHVSEDTSSRDLLDEADRLAREGKLRDAIRKGYIAVLCELADRRIIGLARHKTNRDYLRDLRKREDLYEDVNGLTGTYERNWYGLRPSTDPDWEEFRSRYHGMMSRISGR